jgi:flagellar assembly factor FliW
MEQHIEKMSIPWQEGMEGFEDMQNFDLIVARDDLDSIAEHHKESQATDVSMKLENNMSVLDQQMNRKPAVS